MTEINFQRVFQISSFSLNFTVPPLHRYPPDIYKWIKKNANPRMSIKLMQICKYFCHKKFPYFVINSLDWSEENAFNYSCCLRNINGRMEEPFNNNNLWITGDITLRIYPYIVPKLLKSMIICDATYIHLERQQLSFNEFKILTASGRVTILHCYTNTRIFGESGDISPLEDILQCLPNLERFCFAGAVPSLTTPNISQLKLSPNINFVLFDINEKPFNFDNFVLFMQMYPKARFTIEFYYDLSPSETQGLQSRVDEMVKNGLTDFCPPVIEFVGQNKATLRALKKLQEDYFEQQN